MGVAHHQGHRGVVRAGGEGRPAGERLVEDHPQRVEVGAAVDRPAARLLRRQVRRGAELHPRPGEGGVAEHLGDAEVGQQQAVVLGAQEHVLRLDVAVDDPAPVGVVERGRRLPQVLARLRQAERALLAQAVVEGAPLDVGHHQVGGVVGLAVVVDGEDVGVVERGDRLRLALEARQEVGVRGEVGVEHLDRHAPLEQQIGGEEDLGEAALPDLPVEPVARVEDAALVAHGAIAVSGAFVRTSSTAPTWCTRGDRSSSRSRADQGDPRASESPSSSTFTVPRGPGRSWVDARVQRHSSRALAALD